jgi:hypothetical protein
MFSVSWYHHPHNSAPPNTQKLNQEDARFWTPKNKEKRKTRKRTKLENNSCLGG